MARLMTWVWIAQFFGFLLVALAWLLMPRTFLEVALGLPGDQVLAVACVRMMAAIAVAMALLSSYAAMREDVRARRAFALSFAIAFVGWFALSWTSWRHQGLPELTSGSPHAVIYGPWSSNLLNLALWLVFAGALLNLLYALTIGRLPSRRWLGKPNTLPQRLWFLWALQMLTLTICSLLVLVIPDRLLVFFCVVLPHDLSQPGSETSPLVELLQSNAPTLLALAFVSVHGMHSAREWAWRSLAAIFASSLSLLALAFLVVWTPEHFEWWLWSAFFAMLLFLVMNLLLPGRHNEWMAANVGGGPDGWTFTDLLVGPVLVLRVLLRRRRASHAFGVGASGVFEVGERTGEQQIPHHPFFRPGRRFRVHARFSNRSCSDDASNDVRGAAIHLTESDGDEAFALRMNTGAFAAERNLWGFGTAALLDSLPRAVHRARLRRRRDQREAAVAGIRCAPASFLGLHYHAQTVRLWVDTDDTPHLVRYRLVPPEHESVEESGLPDPERTDCIWSRRRAVDERRAPDYLRQELRQRLEGENRAEMLLQAQFHIQQPGDGLQWFDPSVDWHTGDHPWRTIGTVALDTPLSARDTEKLRFRADNHPPGLDVPSSPSPFDHRSMADSERRIINRLARMRLWMYRALGMPKAVTTLDD